MLKERPIHAKTVFQNENELHLPGQRRIIRGVFLSYNFFYLMVTCG